MHYLNHFFLNARALICLLPVYLVAFFWIDWISGNRQNFISILEISGMKSSRSATSRKHAVNMMSYSRKFRTDEL